MEVKDWVKVKLYNSEVIGYVVEIDAYKFHLIQTSPKIQLKKFDINACKRSFGISGTNYEIINSSHGISKEQVQDLINVALDIKDEEWFYNLTSALKGVSDKVGA